MSFLTTSNWQLATVAGLSATCMHYADWAAGYYPKDLTQSNLVQKLLMCGYGYPDKGCIPYGDVDGVYRQDPDQYTTGMVKVGFNGMTNLVPVHAIYQP